MIQMIGTNIFYILVEGVPDSPELNFIETTISNIFIENNLDYRPQVFEAGSSSTLFNTNIAKVFYKQSKVHQKTPVLVLSDSDYRVHAEKIVDNINYINEKKTKVLYWQRHEWENYLLDETEIIADYINSFPEKPKTNNAFKKPIVAIKKTDLDGFLNTYFRDIENLKSEYWECLKFNLDFNIAQRHSIQKPTDFEEKISFDFMEKWFSSKIDNPPNFTSKPKFQSENLYQQIMTQYNWEKIIKQPDVLDFDFAKQHFRGKEAFKKMIAYINREFECNINHKHFQEEILRKLNENSIIYKDLEKLLLKELHP
jgi:hypothetical protein